MHKLHIVCSATARSPKASLGLCWVQSAAVQDTYDILISQHTECISENGDARGNSKILDSHLVLYCFRLSTNPGHATYLVRKFCMSLNCSPTCLPVSATIRSSLVGSPQMKSAEYENPLNSSCIACVRTGRWSLVYAPLSLKKVIALTRLNRSENRCNARKFRIEVARVRSILDHRLEWRWDLLVS